MFSSFKRQLKTGGKSCGIWSVLYTLLFPCPVPPRIVGLNPDKASVLEGHMVSLMCDVQAYPSPEITWSREGRPLEFSTGMHILPGTVQASPIKSTGSVCALVIHESLPHLIQCNQAPILCVHVCRQCRVAVCFFPLCFQSGSFLLPRWSDAPDLQSKALRRGPVRVHSNKPGRTRPETHRAQRLR